MSRSWPERPRELRARGGREGVRLAVAARAQVGDEIEIDHRAAAAPCPDDRRVLDEHRARPADELVQARAVSARRARCTAAACRRARSSASPMSTCAPCATAMLKTMFVRPEMSRSRRVRTVRSMGSILATRRPSPADPRRRAWSPCRHDGPHSSGDRALPPEQRPQVQILLGAPRAGSRHGGATPGSHSRQGIESLPSGGRGVESAWGHLPAAIADIASDTPQPHHDTSVAVVFRLIVAGPCARARLPPLRATPACKTPDTHDSPAGYTLAHAPAEPPRHHCSPASASR